MAEDKPAFSVDTDWKKQAQEEKKRLAEEEQRRKTEQAGPAGVVATPPPRGRVAGRTRGGREEREREVPPASFLSLVQSLTVQALFYLGDLSQRGESAVNLDMARHTIDTLGVLEEKTRGNLTPGEKTALDHALYETRMRFIGVSEQYAQLP